MYMWHGTRMTIDHVIIESFEKMPQSSRSQKDIGDNGNIIILFEVLVEPDHIGCYYIYKFQIDIFKIVCFIK